MATPEDFTRIGNYAHMHSPNPSINRSLATRTVPLSVLCLGYSRTGTLTMHHALTTLGYPSPYHFSSILANPLDSDQWMAALNAKYNGLGPLPTKKFFDALLGHVGAVTDAPCNLFAAELVAMYPDAKVVLVEREIESWERSWAAFAESAYDPVLPLLARLDPEWLGRIVSVGRATTQVSAGFAGTKAQAKVRSRGAYRRHYAEVREMVPEGRLLEFRLGEGWGPLCAFLGREVPDVPFPHENEKERNKQFFVELGRKGMRNILRNAMVVLMIVGVPVGACYWAYRG
ncbi:hypothetical protein BU16DRAFT_544123 [Lophium mytilinum]|uniref:NAD dependent epimerase/dehydratase n=1 Tax=Lophium mytilinum TaxID=390894 RepID=A0A6A6QBV3_9PEZI|nr:hypothetical protein BU16DRAFT_544123 [Lophium mytilinum]